MAFPSDEALPRPRPSEHRAGWFGTGPGSCQPRGCADTHICHISTVFHLQTSLEVSAYPFRLPGGTRACREGANVARARLWGGFVRGLGKRVESLQSWGGKFEETVGEEREILAKPWGWIDHTVAARGAPGEAPPRVA